MSNLKNLFEVNPAEGPSNNKEFFETAPMPCGYCHGSGYFSGPVSGEGPKPCPTCKGKGYLRAEIIVSWIPTDKITKQ